jgi:hypothetical protein
MPLCRQGWVDVQEQQVATIQSQAWRKVMRLSFAVAFCLLLTLDVGGAFAQSSQPLDILGVQLGMARESAVQLLLSHQPPYSVTNTQTLTVENLGTSVWRVSLGNSRSGIELIDLDFAPPPTKSTVLRISRTVSYVTYINGAPVNKNPDAPLVETFLASLAKKVGSPTPTVVKRRSTTPNFFNITYYVWRRSGELLSSTEFNRLRYPARCLDTVESNPRTMVENQNPRGTYNFHLYFDSALTDDKNFEDICGRVLRVTWTQDGEMIRQFDTTFSDTAGIVLAFAKSAAVIDAKKASQAQQELERAKQNHPQF